ncbi:MAG: hypothetical protein JO170_19735 [Verrucomicrobia bacterium]|nr:hypothetical protein [Verrucomicrobiota bacterium]
MLPLDGVEGKAPVDHLPRPGGKGVFHRVGYFPKTRAGFVWGGPMRLYIGVTEHFAVKSQGSIGDVDLDPELLALFNIFYERRRDSFVVESRIRPRPGSGYAHYRCQRIFKLLTKKLRVHGVAAKSPLHALRKEFGSQICEKRGVYAASRALRHSVVGTTALHYLDKRSRATTGLGALLSTSSESRDLERLG